MPAPRDWKKRFLEAFKNSGNVRVACQAAGVNRQYAYRVRSQNPKFAQEWDDAREEAIDLLEATAWARARAGASDYLLWKLLESNRRSLYGKQIEVRGDPDAPVTTILKVVYEDQAGPSDKAGPADADA